LLLISAGVTLVVGAFSLVMRRVTRDDSSGASEAIVQSEIESLGITLSQEEKGVCALAFKRFKSKEATAMGLLMICIFMLVFFAALAVNFPFPTYPAGSDVNEFVLVGHFLSRVLIAVVFFFGIGILLRFYRYNLKVADFYRSRYDGVILHHVFKQHAEMKGWMDLAHPPYDVGNGKLPMDQLSKVIESMKSAKGTRS
jgi:hypothetical protein